MDALSVMMKYSAGAAQKQTSGSSSGSSTIDVLSRYGKGMSVAPVSQYTGEKQQNEGGFLGGLGYLGEKIGLGFLSGIEGIWDYTAGGLAKLFGADDWAEQQFSNDWVNYNHADEWFNPSKGWQVAGDVAGGIGTSLPALAGVAAAAAIAYFSGGSLSGVSAGIISGVVAGFGAAGNATKQAYKETGELGGKEFGYGFLSGVTEGAVEGLSAGIGAGTGAIVKNMTKSFGKEVAKSAAKEAAKATGKTIAKEAGKQILLGFVGEAFEEGLSEFLDPYWKRMTYDPSAKNATIQEIGYAALIGGLSGAIMSGFDVTVRSTANTIRGNNIVNKGTASDVITTAENIANSDIYTEQYESFKSVKKILNELQTSLTKTDGEVRTIRQKTLLGYLERANTYTVFEPMIQRNAARIVANADAIAQRLTAYGYTDTNGNPITFTAEQIRSGFDVNNPKTFSEALKKNNILRTLAVIDTTGQLYMDTKAFEQATLRGETLSSQVDLNRFIETATKEELDSVAERLEIADWQGLTNEQFKEKIVAFSQNGGIESYRADQAKKAELRAAAEVVSPEKAKKRIPKNFTTKNDGVVRYTQNGVDMAIIKDGDTYRIFDYETARVSKAMTLEQLNSELTKIKEGLDSEITRLQESRTETEERQQAAQLDAYAKENISAYSNLSDANKSLVRGVIRQARAAGISDADALSYARVSAKAGVNISFDRQAKVDGAEVLLVGKNTETGAPVYADGVYLAQTNTIYVNPEAKRTHESLLIHELTHAIYRGKGGSVILMKGVEKMSDAEKQAIVNKYRAAGHGSAVELIDEINAHFAEGQLTNKKLLQRLTEDAPTIKQRILAFFKKSATAYSEDERLSGTAKKLYKQYKKLFDSFSEENQGNNAFETPTSPKQQFGRFSFSGDEYEIAESTIETDGKGKYLSINLSSEAQTKYGALSVRERSNFVKKYIKDQFRHIEFTLTDGKKVIVTGTDAGKMSNTTFEAKHRTALELDRLFEIADFTSSNEQPDHGLFSRFDYYSVRVKIGEDVYTCVLNVGTEQTSGTLRLHDVNQFTLMKKEAPTQSNEQTTSASSLESLRSASNNNISENGEKVNTKKTKTTKMFALPATEPVKPTSDAWSPTLDTTEAKKRFPSLWDVTANESETRNPTQIKGTVSTYRKIYNILKSENFHGKILDASSGLGYGTRLGIEEYGYTVDDIEPYPDGKYKPKFTDYSTLSEKYDVIISNAVLNVLPQDQRDALVVKMGTLLNDGGRLFVNVRGDDVNTLASNSSNIKIGNMEWFVSSTGSYQKGFTRAELVAYLSDALGDGYTVEGTTKFGKTAAIVTKKSGARFALSDEQLSAVKKRGVKGDRLLDVQDLAETISEVGGKITSDGKAVLYHATNAEAAEQIRKTGQMIGKEDRIYFSTKKDGEIKGYGDTVVRVKIPLELLELDDYFRDEAHLTIKTRPNKPTNVRYALPDTDSDGAKLTVQQQAFFKDSKIRIKPTEAWHDTIDETGSLFPVYHGTNTGVFYEFDDKMIGASNDSGWFGRGFYFAFTKGEAKTYGSRVLKCYLNIKKPFYFKEQMYGYKGVEHEGVRASVADFIINFGEQFPDIAREEKVFVRENDGTEHKITLLDLAAEIKATYESERLTLKEVSGDEEKYWWFYGPEKLENLKISKELRAALKKLPIQEPYYVSFMHEDGKISDELYSEYTRYVEEHGESDFRDDDLYVRCQTKEQAQKYKMMAAVKYLIDRKYDFIDFPASAHEIITNNSDKFRGVLEGKGYDGVVQSKYGDEIVAFYPEQIKLTTNENPSAARDIRYALPDTVESDVVKQFGKTYRWVETGYILKDGTRVDLSGRNEGASGGYRSIDHRDVFDGYDVDGTEAMVEFMSRGNIRVMPEGPAINLQVEPTEEQYKQIGNLVETLAWKEKEFTVDFDDNRGNTVDSLSYEGSVSWRKVVSDIRYYFKEGKVPYQSDLSKFRYALPETDSDGTELTVQQREYFNDSKIVDEQGRLKVVYHGTRSVFTQFSRDRNYFTDSQEVADSYAPAKIKMTGYLNIKKPFIIDAKGERWSRIPVTAKFKKLLDRYGGSTFYEDGKLRTSTADIAATIMDLVDDGKADYDGIIIKNVEDVGQYWTTKSHIVANDYIVFSSEQFKLTTNKTPTTNRDIRFALPDDTDEGSMGGYSRGQRAKFAANNTALKVYSRADAEAVINEIMEERFVFEDDGQYGEISAKTRDEVVDYLFRKLNTVKEGYRIPVALNIADYLIEHATIVDMYADGVASEAIQELQVYRSFMHRIDLSGIQKEIEYTFDKRNGINMVWGAPKGKGIAPDTLGMELEEYGIFLKGDNEADLFIQLVERYRKARDLVAEGVKKQTLLDVGNKQKLEELRQQIARDILLAYDKKGTQSKYGKLVEKYTKQIESLKQQVREANAYNRLINSVIDKAQKMRDLKLGTFLNATEFKNEVFKSSIEALGNIKYRGNFNEAGTRKILANLRTWYVPENPILADSYEQGVADMLDSLIYGKKRFTREELITLNNVMAYFTRYVETFNKVYKNGKWIEALPEAQRYVSTMQANADVKVGLFQKVAGSTYMQTFGDPMTVARRMDLYEPNGFFTETMTSLRDAAVDAQVAEMEIMSQYDDFMKRHKRYLRDSAKQTVEYKGAQVPRITLVGLYMTIKRQHAQAGLAQNGFAFIDADGKRVRVDGFAQWATDELDIHLAATAEQERLLQLLTEKDREYIAILEKGYNEDAKNLKAERDMQRLGFTNATEDYYYPIRRGNIAHNVDTSDIQGELDRVSNASFNKDTVRGAKQELFIESADVVFKRHIHAVVQYAYLSPAIEAYNRLYNLDVSGNPNKPVSVATEAANAWAKGNKYISKIISDIQGIPAASGEGNKVLRMLRGNYAKFQLAANPKVWLTQLSSIFASSSMLDISSITRGMTVSARDVDTYCSLAKLRNYDSTAARAQGILDKVGKTSDVLMAPIGKMDRFVVCRLFGACQVQVAKNSGPAIGTEANKIAAGELLRRVILETQQNAISTERSAAMRSGNVILETVTMFTADSMKVVGRVIDSIGEFSTIRAKLKVTTDANVRTKLQSQLKLARKKVAKSVTALVTTALFMAGIAQLFRLLYNKIDDDENVGMTALIDFIGNLFGGLPLIKDLYARIAEGYSFNNYAYSSVNDLLDSSLNLIESAKNVITGEGGEQAIVKGTKDLAFSLGQLFGIPTRNVYNIAYGLTKRISPTTAYDIDSKMYKKNYTSDLKKALEKGDDAMVAHLMSLIYDQRTGSAVNDSARKKLSVLYAKGYNILPRAIGNSITYDGEEIEMSEEQRSRFVSIYSSANEYIEKMLASSSYDKLNEEKQAKAIKSVYDAFYYRAISDLVGQDANNTLGDLSRYIALDKLAIAFSELSEITSDVDKKGNVINGSKKKKTIAYLLKQNLTDGERLLILYFRGYTILDGDFKGYTKKRARTVLLKYIFGLKATAAEKARIAAECGFTVRNGKIDKSSL